MDRQFFTEKETGIATLIAIVAVVVLGILLAGLLPLGANTTRSAAFTRDVLQAQYIAEAGAKRGIVALRTATAATNWGWLGNPPVDVTNSTSPTAQYNVSITPPAGVTLAGIPAAGIYTVTSVGRYGRFTKAVTVQVAITTGTLPDLSSTFCIGGDITTEPTTSSYKIKSNGYLTYSGSISNKVKFDGNLGTQTTTYVKYDETQEIAEIDIASALASATKTFNPPAKMNDKVYLTAGIVYAYNSSLNLNVSNCDIYGPTGDNHFAVVVVNGDLTISASAFHIKDNVVFLVKGNFVLNSGGAEFQRGLVYCNENAIIENAGSNFTCQMIVRKNLVLKHDLSNSNPCNFIGLKEYLGSTVKNGGTTVSNWAKGNLTY
jgi:type II secretory pathway pseudopilin PulG